MLEPLLDVICENYRMCGEIRKAWTTLFDVIANIIEIYRDEQAQLYYAARRA